MSNKELHNGHLGEYSLLEHFLHTGNFCLLYPVAVLPQKVHLVVIFNNKRVLLYPLQLTGLLYLLKLLLKMLIH